MSSPRVSCLTALGATAFLVASLAGCGASADLAQREIIVLFDRDTPHEVRMKVRQACADLPGTSPRQPPPESEGGSIDPYGMRFRIDRATAAQRTQLYECLGQFESVKGVKQPGM